MKLTVNLNNPKNKPMKKDKFVVVAKSQNAWKCTVNVSPKIYFARQIVHVKVVPIPKWMHKNCYLFENSWIQKGSQKIKVVNAQNQDVTKSIVIVTAITKNVDNHVSARTVKTLTRQFLKSQWSNEIFLTTWLIF